MSASPELSQSLSAPPEMTDGFSSLCEELMAIAKTLENAKSLSTAQKCAGKIRGLAKVASYRDGHLSSLTKDRDEWRSAHGVLLESVVPALAELKKKTYSAVAGADAQTATTPSVVSVHGRRYPAPKARSAVKICPDSSSLEKYATSADTEKALKRNVDPSKIGGVLGMRKCGGSGVVVFATSDLAAQRLANSTELRSAGLSVTVPEPRMPRVIIYDVPRDSADVLPSIMHHNLKDSVSLTADEFAQKCKLSHRAGPREGSCHVVMSVAPEIRAALLDVGRLYIGWQSCRVKDYIGVTLCRKCCHYGHPEKYCREQSPTCFHCGVVGHSKSACPSASSSAKCATCCRFKRPAGGHQTGAPSCPAREAAVVREIGRTSFK